MKRTPRLTCAGLTLAALALTACGGVEGAAGSASGSGGGEGALLQFANPNAPTDSTARLIDWWGEEVVSQVPDEVRIEQKYSGSLLPGAEVRAGVSEGRAAGGQLIPAYHQAEMPLSNLTSVPVPYDSEVIAKAFQKLIAENDQVAAEYSEAGLEPLFVGPTGTWLLATKDPVTDLDQLKGKKIRLLPPAVPAYEQFGVEPVFVSSEEIYESLERGVLDGVSSVINVLHSVGVQEVAPNFVIDGIGNYTIWVMVMGTETFESLDPAVQEAMTKTSAEALEHGTSIITEVETEACQGIVKAGGRIAALDEDDQDEMREAATRLVDTWYAGAEEAGHERADLESIWDEYNRYLEEFEPTSTYESGVEPCL
jgi:TRAP-type transport system periplasmic protein